MCRSSGSIPTFASVDFNIINGSYTFKEESISSPTPVSEDNVSSTNVTKRRLLLPIVQEESRSYDSSNDVLSRQASVSNSPSKDATLYISTSTPSEAIDPNNIPILASELTNLCSGLSLTQASEMPTNFRECRPLFTTNDDITIKMESLASDMEASQSQFTTEYSVDCEPVAYASEAGESVTELDHIDLGEESNAVLVSTSADAAAGTRIVPDKDSVKDSNATVSKNSNSTENSLIPPVPSNVSLSEEMPSVSSNGRIKLVILKQPERQHRARYLTEGSRGAVKDQEGSGHPIIEVNNPVY